MPRLSSRGYKRHRSGQFKDGAEATSSTHTPTSRDSTWSTSSDSDNESVPPKRHAEEQRTPINGYIRNWLTPHTKPIRPSPFRQWQNPRANRLGTNALSHAQLQKLSRGALTEMLNMLGDNDESLGSLRKIELIERIALRRKHIQGTSTPKPLVQPRLVLEGGTLGLSIGGPTARPVFQRSPHSRRLRRFESPSHGRTPRKSPYLAKTMVPPVAMPVLESVRESEWVDQPSSDAFGDSDSSLSSLSDAPDSPSLNARIPSAPAVPVKRMRIQSDEHKNAPEGSSTTKEDAAMSRTLLARRRRQSLADMCAAKGIEMRQESTKAELIAALLGEPSAEKQTADNEDLNGLDLESLQLLDHEISPESLEKLERIGTGGFKDVYLGLYHISRTRSIKVAISDIRNEITDMDIKELRLLRDLRHENIVRFIGVSIPPPPRLIPCMIVTELCENGDLFDFIRNTPAPPDAEIFTLLLQIARGLEYLHKHTPTIIHRDCKSTNVLITKDCVAKISDFGFARVKRSSRTVIQSLVGTVNWQAAELWVPKPNYNEKVDVWSAAMTFWEALQWHQPIKRYPFQGMNEHQIYFNVGQKGQRRRFGDEIVDLLHQMWEKQPRDRPTMTQVCERLEELVAMKRSSNA
ncbi:non-specific serine/threonine protein kinase [Malassezia cuniculi]|uniref:Non-specific serine/threonine protein kinase n=1 Tax=Malassezia cuniculi TaxID=948313 RepID=A0AAF0J722_9BASI|nr:non-specific serine/threonine protein kinase [Malassezia cuniculi]